MKDIAKDKAVVAHIRATLKEDVGAGDVTTLGFIGTRAQAEGRIVARQACVLSGITVACAVLRQVNPRLKIRQLQKDGAQLAPGDAVLTVRGSARSILTAERVTLNYLQRMSGIATLTKQYVDQVKPHRTKVLDTRKTTPTLRVFEKYAVLCGGGANHRIGLYDRVLIKDNHLAAWRATGQGTLAAALQMIRRKQPGLLIEIEVENTTELRDALAGRPDWILLDNMTTAQLRECVRITEGRALLEASGGVNLRTIGRIAATGVDAVSVGALTHSAPAVDFSMDFAEQS